MQFQPLRMLVKSHSSPDIQKINFATDLNETFHKIRDFEKTTQ